MSAYSRQYVSILNSREILYLPTCLIVEMMAKLLFRLADREEESDADTAVSELADDLNAFHLALLSTRIAYDSGKMRFFIGDWKNDRDTVRNALIYLLDRLRDLSERAGPANRRVFEGLVGSTSGEGLSLIATLDNQIEEGRTGSSVRSCHYFRSMHAPGWRRVMARTAVVLDHGAHYRDDRTSLLLLCYRCIKQQLVTEIKGMGRKLTHERQFNPDRLLVVSEGDTPASCPDCSDFARHCCRAAGDRTTKYRMRREARRTTVVHGTAGRSKTAVLTMADEHVLNV